MRGNNGRDGETKQALLVEEARVEIRTNQQQRLVLDQAVEVLLRANDPPVLFRYNNRLVTVCTSSLEIKSVSSAMMYKRLINLADWIRITSDGKKNSSPPAAIINALLDDPDVGFPELDAVSSIPSFDSEFRLISEPGYDASARVYLAASHDLKSIGTEMHVREARDLILEAIQDFPFTNSSSLAHGIALLLLPFVRPALGNSPTPLHMIESPTPGSGKGRLADLASTIAYGRPCRPTSLSGSRSENTKKLTSLLAAGAEMIILDNLPQESVLHDPVLASMLTSATPAERLLGRNTILRLKNRAIWIATANNPRTSLELSRRCVCIRLEPQCDRPWLRKGFVHPNLLDWARRRRSDLVRACLGLVQSWVDSKTPLAAGKVLGSFEQWSFLMGGILQNAGVSGFLDDLELVYEKHDAESKEWRLLADVWRKRFDTRPLTATDVQSLCQELGLLEEIRGYGAPRSQVSRLGRALQRNSGRIFGNFQLHCDNGAVRSSARYVLKDVGQSAPKST